MAARYLSPEGIDASQIITEQGSGTTYDRVPGAVSCVPRDKGPQSPFKRGLRELFEHQGIEVRTSLASESVIDWDRAYPHLVRRARSASPLARPPHRNHSGLLPSIQMSSRNSYSPAG